MATNHQNVPRAVIHRQILDSAATQPEASMEALAKEVTGASTDLVERVLDEYGDPAAEEPPEERTDTEEPMSEHATQSGTAEYTQKELETLRAIAEHPNATQGELAERLGVSRATVNKRLNDLEGFEWRDRRAFVTVVFGDENGESSPTSGPAPGGTDAAATVPVSTEAASDGGQRLARGTEASLSELTDRVSRLEQQLAEPTSGRDSMLEDSELVAKLVRAVMADEAISGEEELRILAAFL